MQAHSLYISFSTKKDFQGEALFLSTPHQIHKLLHSNGIQKQTNSNHRQVSHDYGKLT